jgi:ParB family transcriptional regulator, chromosome partitioning protein
MNERDKMTPKQRGLGRGLDALFEDEEETFAGAAEKQNGESAPPSKRTLGIGQLVPNANQPRTHFDPKAIAELADSIKQHGLIQPILVRPVAGQKDMYEIVAGERRWRASQKAQLHEVPVVIRELDDAQVLQIALIENLLRQDLNPLEEAKGYQRLMDDFAFTAEDVGVSVSRSRSHVTNMVRLLALPQSVQDMLVSGDLSAGHARALLTAQNPALLAQEVASKKLSVRETERLAANAAGRDIQSRPKAGKAGVTFKDPNILALEKDLTNVLGLKVSIAMKGETEGSLSVAFKTLDQLDDVLLRLSKFPKVLE